MKPKQKQGKIEETLEELCKYSIYRANVSPNNKEPYITEKITQVYSDIMALMLTKEEIEKVIRDNGEYKARFAVGLQDKLEVNPKLLAQAIHKAQEDKING